MSGIWRFFRAGQKTEEEYEEEDAARDLVVEIIKTSLNYGGNGAEMAKDIKEKVDDEELMNWYGATLEDAQAKLFNKHLHHSKDEILQIIKKIILSTAGGKRRSRRARKSKTRKSKKSKRSKRGTRRS